MTKYDETSKRDAVQLLRKICDKVFCLVAHILYLLSVCSAIASSSEPVRIQADLTTALNKEIVGVGWNVGPFYLPAPRADRQKFFQLMEESGQPWIRMCLQYFAWEGRMKDGKFVLGNDDDDPWTSAAKLFRPGSDCGFIWNTPEGLNPSLVAVLDFCEQHDIWVEMNNWSAWHMPWINERYIKAEDFAHPIRYETYLADAQEFGIGVRPSIGAFCSLHLAVDMGEGNDATPTANRISRGHPPCDEPWGSGGEHLSG